MKSQLITTQFIRYAIVGLAINSAGYLLYLALTWSGLGHKFAMTLLYVTGTLLTFVLNRRWTFNHSGAVDRAILRHWTAYGLGYVVNFLGLLVFVDYLGLPHEIVQGLLILAVAAMLFLLQRYWVFRASTHTL